MTDASGLANERLQSLIERIERLEAEKASIAEDIKEVYAEAKSAGFDTKIMRQVVRLRKMDQKQRQEEEQLRDVYEAALGALKDTPLADAAMKRDGVKKAEGDGGTVLKRPGKPLTNEEAEALSDELAKVPGVTSVKVVRVTTSVVPPEGRASSPDAPPPKDVAGSLASIKAAMHAPAR